MEKLELEDEQKEERGRERRLEEENEELKRFYRLIEKQTFTSCSIIVR